MLNLNNKEDEKTFSDLQKPTMSLIASFYPMSEEIQEIFSDMMAIYEANPTEETAKKLSDTIMGRSSTEEKKAWIKEQADKVMPQIRKEAKKKYIEEQQAVPKGVPTSGMLLVGLDVVSREEKDALMEVQAAARIISHINVLDKYQPKTNYKNEDGTFRNNFLDKPFATERQRLEDLADAIVNQIYTQNYYAMEEENKRNESQPGAPILLESDVYRETRKECARNGLLRRIEMEAGQTLLDVGKKLSGNAPNVGEKIYSLGKSVMLIFGQQGKLLAQLESKWMEFGKQLAEYQQLGLGSAPISEVSSFMKDDVIMPLRALEEACKKGPLQAEDFKKLKETYADTPAGALIAHRADQIIAMEAALAKEKAKKVAAQR